MDREPVVDQLFFRLVDRGGEMVAENLRAGLVKRGYDVENIGFFRDRDDHAPVTGHWPVLADSNSAGAATPRALVAWVRRLRARRPSVVIAHTQVAALLGLTVAAIAGVPRRIAVDHQPQGQELGRVFQLADMVCGTLGVFTDVVHVSQINVDKVSRYPKRYRRRVSILANEVPPPDLPSRQVARRNLGLDPDQVVFCFLGVLSDSKGAVVAAEAVATHHEAILVMAGREGNAAGEVDRLVERSDGRIRLLGHLQRQGVDQVLAAADVLLFPSYAENRSMTLLEALSAGLVVAAGDVPANRFVIAEGENRYGTLLDAGDQQAWNQLVATLAQPDGLKQAQQSAATRDDGWSALLDGYEALMAGTRPVGMALTS